MPAFAASSFVLLPLEEQLDLIDAAIAGEETEFVSLLDACGSLPEGEPMLRLLEGLNSAAQYDELTGLPEALGKLPAPALLFVLNGASAPLKAALAGAIATIVKGLGPERIALTGALVRWLRRHGTEHFDSLEHDSANHASLTPWKLLFWSGEDLQEHASEELTELLNACLDGLARRPKSLSQSNAEAMLGQDVYASPGHCFFELLQNAEDAGASTWEVEVQNDFVRVRHDGRPFSLADIIGVLSLGQSTKKVGQIGRFGVGFKSVYALTERPRLLSGAFHLEIAHHSIPRPLPSATTTQTELLLPRRRRAPIPPKADTLFESLRDLAPETLLTLKHLRSITLRGPGGEVHAWHRQDSGPWITIAETEPRHYALGQAGPCRAAVLLTPSEGSDLEAAPTTLPLFAYLPTNQHTGLSSLLHAPFELTLDRERIAETEGNTELLRQGARAFIDAATQLLNAGISPLPVLPLPSDLSPLLQPFGDALFPALEELPCFEVPGSQERQRASALLLAPPELSALLEGCSLRGKVVAALPDPRTERLAETLGAPRLQSRHIIGLLEELSAGTIRPSWLCAPVLDTLTAVETEVLQRLCLLPTTHGMQRPDQTFLASDPVVAFYREHPETAPPLITDIELRALGTLHASLRPKPLPVAMLLDDVRKLLAHQSPTLKLLEALGATLPQCSSEHRTAIAELPLWSSTGGYQAAEDLWRLEPELESLRSELESRIPLLEAGAHPLANSLVRPLDVEALVLLLGDSLERAPIDLVEAQALRLALVPHCQGLRSDLRHALGLLPIFECTGGLRPLQGDGAGRVPESPELTECWPHGPWLQNDALTELLNAQAATASWVAEALREGNAPPAVLPWLASEASTLRRGEIAALFDASVWPDHNGEQRSLFELYRDAPSNEPAIVAHYAQAGPRHPASFIATSTVDAFGLSERLPAAVASTLAQDLVATPPEDLRRPEGREVLSHLAAIKGLAEQLWRLPIFADREGHLRPLKALTEANLEAEEECVFWPGDLRGPLGCSNLTLLSAEDEALFADLFTKATPPGPSIAALLAIAASGCAAEHDAPRWLTELRIPERCAVSFDAGMSLDGAANTLLQTLPLFESQAGAFACLDHLASPEDVSALPAAAIDALGLSPLLLSRAHAAVAEQLGLSPMPAASALAQLPWAQLGVVEDAPSTDLPEALQSATVLASLASHFSSLEAAPPLAVAVNGTLQAPPLRKALPAYAALAAALPTFAPSVAAPAWSEALRKTEQHGSWLRDADGESIAQTLRQGVPFASLPLVYAWLRETEGNLDAATVAHLSKAPIAPTKAGGLAAPGNLLLHPLGVDFPSDAISPERLLGDIPGDVRDLLRKHIPFDRKQRRTVVQALLDAIDAHIESGPEALSRHHALLQGLADALGFGDAGFGDAASGKLENSQAQASAQEPSSANEERVRYNKVRARLRCPLERTDAHALRWEKPRRATLSKDIDALRSCAGDVPPLIDYGAPLSPGQRQLLGACGAELEVPDSLVDALLEGSNLLPGREHERFAYILARLDSAEDAGAVVTKFRLRERHWIPTSEGRCTAPASLFWPEGPEELPLPVAELGPGFPALTPSLRQRVPDEHEGLFRSLRDLSPKTLAAHWAAGEDATNEALCDWLESALRAGIFDTNDFRRHLAPLLRLKDETGHPRKAAHLCEEGASLFGPHRGNIAQAHRWPELIAALGIPAAPSTEMARAFLEEFDAGLLDVDAEVDLEALRELAPEGTEESVPEGVEASPEPSPGTSTAAATTVAPPEGNFWGRVRRFFQSDSEDPAAPEGRALESRAIDLRSPEHIDAQSFRPTQSLTSQLHDATDWLERRERRSEYGIAFTPEKLPLPWRYAPQLLSIDYNHRGQRWRRSNIDFAPLPGDVGRVHVQAAFPAGKVQLPLPHLGRLLPLPGDLRAAGQQFPTLRLKAAAQLRYDVVLSTIPPLESCEVWSGAHDNASAQLVPHDELPEEAHDFLADLSPQAPPIHRALAIRDFIRRRYRYDPSYLENPGVARWLRGISAGRPHAHIAALHAGRTTTHLGAGVCFDLNALCCEMLRRAGLPTAVASGWVLDGGSASEPDHFWAVLLLQHQGQPFAFPIDASTTRAGRLLRVPHRKAKRNLKAPKGGRSPKDRGDNFNLELEASAQGEAVSRRARRKQRRDLEGPRRELAMVLRHWEKISGEPLPEARLPLVRKALEDAEIAKRVLEMLLERGDE